jgi:hypothetical protein
MITQGNIDNLYKITANLAKRDYLITNPKRRVSKQGYVIHNRYSLSDETLEAYDFYNLSIRDDISREDEERIKAYLLKVKTVIPELLAENESYKQWKNAHVIQQINT